MEVKLSNFIVALIMVSLFIAVIGAFMGKLSTNYSVDYDNSSINTMNKLDDLSEDTEELEDSALGMKEKTGVLDIIGGFFSDAYATLKISVKSYDLLFGSEGMGEEALEHAQLGDSTKYFRIALSSIVVLLLIFVIVKAVTKTDV